MSDSGDRAKTANIVDDLLLAAAFSTRLPFGPAAAEPGRLAGAAWAFAVVGLGVGLAGALALGLLAWLGLPSLPAAVAAVAVQVLITGALHEDGLADTADGFGGGRDRDAKLEIMRDPRTGAYGAVALVLVLAGRIAALAALADASAAGALIVAAAAGRAGMVWAMAALPAARAEGLGADAGRPTIDRVWVALAVAALAALLLLGITAAIVTIVVGIAAAMAVVGLARRQIGGQTGDLLGAAEQTVELACLFAAAAVLA